MQETIVKDKQFYIDCFIGWCKRKAGFVQRFANYNEYYQEGIYDVKIPNVGALRLCDNWFFVFEKSKYDFEHPKPKEFQLSKIERYNLARAYVDGIKEEHLRLLKEFNETEMRHRRYANPQFQVSIFDYFHEKLRYYYRVDANNRELLVFVKDGIGDGYRRKFSLTQEEFKELESYR